MAGINFTRPAAERIAAAVRAFEGGSRDGSAFTWDRPWDSKGCKSIFRIAKYTGSWDMNTEKTIAFHNHTYTPNTAVCMNVFVDLPNRGTAADALVGVVREKDQWFLWTWQEFTATAIFASSVQDITVLNDLQVTAQISTNDCSIVVSTTETTTSITTVQNTYTCSFVTLSPVV